MARTAERVIMLVAVADKREAVARAWRGEVPSGIISSAEWWITEDALPVAPPAG